MQNSSTQQSQKTFLFHEKSKNAKGQRKSVAGIVEGNQLRIGISTCGPKDQFVKKLGHKISMARAEKKPSKVIYLDGEQSTRDVFFDALKAL